MRLLLGAVLVAVPAFAAAPPRGAAPRPAHWSLRRPVQPAVPQLTDPSLRPWASTPLDAFILARLVRERRETIVAEFQEWITVPGSMQEDSAQLAHYGEMLLSVARIVEHDGDPRLLAMLEGDPADAPVETWNEEIATAASLSGQGRFAEAAQVLESLAGRMAKLRGSAVDFYRPRVLGKLGIALFQAGEYLPEALALAVTLEFAAIGAGLIVAGRSGASLGAELGSMRLTEQIDALEVLGLSPLRELVGPRVMACMIALPLLTVFIAYLALLAGGLAEMPIGGGAMGGMGGMGGGFRSMTIPPRGSGEPTASDRR